MRTCTSILIFSLSVLSCEVDYSRSAILCDDACDTTEQDVGICMDDSSARVPIYLMAFFPCNTANFRARGLAVAGQMAARAVRMTNGELLQGYNLELALDNTMVSDLEKLQPFCSGKEFLSRKMSRSA